MSGKPLGWLGIARLGLVQSALGAVVVLTTSTLNRVMVVELALPAMLPAALVAWHYGVQLSRPRWGHGSDAGGRRTPWIVAGMGVLAMGGIMAANATALMASSPAMGTVLGVLAFAMIGGGVGASGTSLLALLASRTAPERRPAAAAVTWIMMVLGIAATAGIAGGLLDPFSFQRLALVSSGVAMIAFVTTVLAVWRVEPRVVVSAEPVAPHVPFRQALAETLSDRRARMFAAFVFVSMLAYSAQDLILEPFAGLIFGMTPGQSTQMAGVQHGGVLLGMIVTGLLGARLGGGASGWMRNWTVAGCVGSAFALLGLAFAGTVGPGWPLIPNVFLLGLFNGVFAVAAIGSMMGLAGEGEKRREGVRLGVWGASQAVAFGLGGFLGAAGVDVGRTLLGSDAAAFLIVFGLEAALFAVSALIALGLTVRSSAPMLTEARHAGA
jgi:MFS transporter, BCD family, chlorophyll transporter